MNYDLEAIMAKELEGKFFWCPSVDEEVGAGKMATEIREAQRKFFEPKKLDAAARRALERERLKGLKAEMSEARALAKLTFIEEVGFLRSVVAKTHGVETWDIVRKTSTKKHGHAKHHFVWCLTRYYPEVSIAELGRQIGKHHSTIIHGRNEFDALKGKYAEEIAVVDEVMGYDKR